MSDEITVKELADETGYTVSAICQAIKRGYLTARKEGRTVYLPAFESKLILMSRKPGEHWIKGRSRPGKLKARSVGMSTMIAERMNQPDPLQAAVKDSLADIGWDAIV